MVFYRKYRPQTIEELDNQKVREILTSILTEKNIPHAFLFTGPKGLGKTSAARIVAKVLNCEKREEKREKRKEKLTKDQRPKTNDQVEPCNKCEQCVSITNGTNIDVLEIDGASNRGIDEIRGLREAIRLMPVSSAYKVYIIDEVHMLTTEAFNALLKTLEEPPPHAVFVLCTTEPHKVPPTILSRCFHIPFTLATKEELVRSLGRIIKSENIDIDKEVLLQIASLSEGSFRDGAKILEELAAIARGKSITLASVEEKYKLAGVKRFTLDSIKFLARKDTKAALLIIDNLVKLGVDFAYFTDQLIEELHRLLLREVGIVEDAVSQEHPHLSIDEIKDLVVLLTRARGELKYAVVAQLPLELVVIEWCLQNKSPQVQAKTTEPSVHQDKKIQVAGENGFLPRLIEQVKLSNHSIAGVLRGCTVKEFDGKMLILETSYKFHKERLERKSILDILKNSLLQLTGNNVEVSVILRDKKPA